jgi:ABC-2 type transport system ATP-binding protein
MTTVIELEQLSVTFGKRPILKSLRRRTQRARDRVAWAERRGKDYAHSYVARVSPADIGHGAIFGQDIVRDAKEVRTGIGYMPESDSFISKMSCVQFVRLMAELSASRPIMRLNGRTKRSFSRLGEARYRPVDSYSLGMKQLAKLARRSCTDRNLSSSTNRPTVLTRRHAVA